MNETKYGIGYTIFKWNGHGKEPIAMVKGEPGNFEEAIRQAQKKMQRMTQRAVDSKKLWGMCAISFLWGIMSFSAGFTLR